MLSLTLFEVVEGVLIALLGLIFTDPDFFGPLYILLLGLGGVISILKAKFVGFGM